MHKYYTSTCATLNNFEYWLEPHYTCKKLDKKSKYRFQKHKDVLPKIYVPKTCDRVNVFHFNDRTIIKLIPKKGTNLNVINHNIPKKKNRLSCFVIGKPPNLHYRLFGSFMYQEISLTIISEYKLRNDFSIKKYLPSFGGGSYRSSNYTGDFFATIGFDGGGCNDSGCGGC